MAESRRREARLRDPAKDLVAAIHPPAETPGGALAAIEQLRRHHPGPRGRAHALIEHPHRRRTGPRPPAEPAEDGRANH